ncbi:hypothetical protein PSPO01_13912 [Paraphaeosphaeria sporulosa]
MPTQLEQHRAAPFACRPQRFNDRRSGPFAKDGNCYRWMLAQLPVPLHPHADTGTAKTDPGEAADTPTDMGGTPIQSFPTEGSTFLTEIIPPKRRITPLRDIPPSKFPSKCKGADSPRHASFQLGGAAGSRLSKTPDLFHSHTQALPQACQPHHSSGTAATEAGSLHNCYALERPEISVGAIGGYYQDFKFARPPTDDLNINCVSDLCINKTLIAPDTSMGDYQIVSLTYANGDYYPFLKCVAEQRDVDCHVTTCLPKPNWPSEIANGRLVRIR